MAGTELGLKYPQFRRRSVTEDLRKWREQFALPLATGTVATPQDPQPKPAKERVENPGPVIVNRSGATTGRTGPACGGNLLDLVLQYCTLELRQNCLPLLELEPQFAMTLIGQTETEKLFRPLFSRLSSRFYDDPNVHISLQ